MRSKNNPIRAIVSCLLVVALLAPAMLFHVDGSEQPFSGEAQAYYESLITAGFPADYALSLTELHLVHPEWRFVPLKITELEPKYTWDYVITAETKETDNNLIASDESHIPYRHPTETKLHDAGKYAASVEAVEYFMDPRNFLNETDIFQFYDLASADGVTTEAVQAVLASTFMEEATLENGLSYAEYFMEVGLEVGVNPIYLAVKARQEQGVNGTSPLLSGTCGTLLNDYFTSENPPVTIPDGDYTSEELLALDGLYNFYNIGASGDGHFLIYYNALQSALSGTPMMAETWGGSPAWNRLWKAIYGGAYNIQKSYIGRQQNTIYLQKFDVYPNETAGNFWHQYEQNVAAALTQARILYSSLASLDALDATATFQIPVYGDMPAQASPDPANGSCSYLTNAKNKYSYSVSLSSATAGVIENTPLYLSQTVPTASLLKLNGTIEHSYGVTQLEYRWDAEDWTVVESTSEISLSLPIDFSPGSSHILLIRGKADYDHNNSAKKCNMYFLAAVLYVEIEPPPTIDVTFEDGADRNTMTVTGGEAFRLPTVADTERFIGWLSSDGDLYAENAEVTLREETTFQALYLNALALDGAALICSDPDLKLRFSMAIDQTLLERLSSSSASVSLRAAVFASDEKVADVDVLEKKLVTARATQWQVYSADTLPLTENDLSTLYSIVFSVQFHYTDGASRTFSVTTWERSAAYVAKQALMDGNTIYSPALETQLKEILRFAN